MRRMTYGERMDLAIKLWVAFIAFMLLGFVLLVIGGQLGGNNIVSLIPGALSVLVGIFLAEISLWVRYHEKKVPKSFSRRQER